MQTTKVFPDKSVEARPPHKTATNCLPSQENISSTSKFSNPQSPNGHLREAHFSFDRFPPCLHSLNIRKWNDEKRRGRADTDCGNFVEISKCW